MNTSVPAPQSNSEFRSDWQDRIHELSLLEDGWLDGDDGFKISTEVIEAASAFCEKLEKEHYPSPAIFPGFESGEGEIVFQFTMGSDRSCREVICLNVLPGITYDMHRVRISDRSYADFTTPFMCAALQMIKQWVIDTGWEFPTE